MEFVRAGIGGRQIWDKLKSQCVPGGKKYLEYGYSFAEIGRHAASYRSIDPLLKTPLYYRTLLN
ncbi:MAG: hypothetical protein AB9866_25805 [Syntrophobacteraceae bacterium]